jgi:hypothetical protein
MKNITAAISDMQYRTAARLRAAERPRRNQNATHRFRGVNKCDPPQPPQSQAVNHPAAESHSIAANVQL